MEVLQSRRDAFTSFVKEIEPRLRFALVAAAGPDRGLEGLSHALAYGWEHWDRVSVMENPAGYLYRVGSRHARNLWPSRPRFPVVPVSDARWVEPGLPEALKSLSPMQRQVVVLVGSYGFSHREVAGLLSIGASTVQKHLERGLAKLRVSLGVFVDG